MNNELIFKDPDWFSHNIPSFSAIFDRIKPKRILEIGSYEGRSAAYMIEKALQYHQEVELFCIDTWEGGQEHIGVNDMNMVERNFLHNMQVMQQRYPGLKLHQLKGYSHPAMMQLCTQGLEGTFDFIYVDGSHEAPDVLMDALLAHRLARKQGVIAFDDYLWTSLPYGQQDHYLLVKPAVDSYINTYNRKVCVWRNFPLYQLYVEKIAD
ncbi:class I SAM-dependent methyltransferase [Pelistega suis]|uniref:Class I SAM-dependent methyltransferase n=1 Tax=Pelistega suis TaxID=1631957 RepID=A0A849P3I9_9BURK|nr:class I SAM-dependent methyltransferase [Pelistega suis]NOL51616.1 class I SAM-dependent methyltransferase [Pelistega suis]